MRRIMLMAAMIILTGLASMAQVFEKGSQAINLGIGIGNTGYFGSYYSGFLPSFSGSYEYGIVEVPMGSDLTGVVSVGGYMGWSMAKYGYDTWGNDDYYLTTDFIIAVRGNYHFIFHEKFDPYAGIALGVDIQGSKWHGNGDDPNIDYAETTPYGGAYAGARYYFSDKVAVYAEVGWLISVLNVGVTFKLK
jgi:hypothetical protein